MEEGAGEDSLHRSNLGIQEEGDVGKLRGEAVLKGGIRILLLRGAAGELHTVEEGKGASSLQKRIRHADPYTDQINNSIKLTWWWVGILRGNLLVAHPDPISFRLGDPERNHDSATRRLGFVLLDHSSRFCGGGRR